MGCVNSSKSDRQSSLRINKTSLKLQSTILTTNQMKNNVISLLRERFNKFDSKLTACSLQCRGSQIGYNAKKFHELSDNKSSTLLLVKTQDNKIFGGYTSCKWKNNIMYQFEEDQNKQSFLFNLSKKSDEGKQWKTNVFPIIQKQNAIMNCESQGPIFGAGHDLHITDQCNKNQNWANMGKSYSCSHKFGSNKANSMLAGSIRFLIEEYQLWSIEIRSLNM